eukprot:jgi/Mesen1/8554/ME000489S07945
MAYPGGTRWLCQICRHPLEIVGERYATDASKPGESHGGGGRHMEESFVVLPSAAASMYGHDGAAAGGDPGGLAVCAAGGAHGATGHGSLDARITALTRVFEIASQQTQVDHPLCSECTQAVQEELEREMEDVQEEVKKYEACLARLQAHPSSSSAALLSPGDFEREQAQAEEEERRLQAQVDAVEAQRGQVQEQLRDVERRSAELDDLEQRYWHDLNDFKLHLHSHQEERDAVLAQIQGATAQLDALKHTHVLSEAFHISHEGDFGTINNFRLGRLAAVPVEWDEINAAWGQACLLLFTMAHTCSFTFTYHILPMGSYPRISDGRHSYELYGPVNLLFTASYDKAMVLFLACLQQFADFAHERDKASGSERLFQLPYKIDGDKVNGFSIKLSGKRDGRWTKALGYMLGDLKCALAWLIRNANPTRSRT